MFGFAIIGYLFLGGLGAGAFFVAACGNLWDALRQTQATARAAAFLNPGFHLAPAALFGGIVLLALDIGNINRIWQLLAQPFSSVLGTGAVALAAAFVLSAAYLAYRVSARRPRLAVHWLCTTLGIVLSLATMSYTGLLLSRSLAFDVWMTPWLVVLFVVSSLSAGLAAILACRSLQATYAKGITPKSAAWKPWRAAGMLAAAEALALAAFLFDRFTFGGTADDSVRLLLTGSLSGVFWVFVVGGCLITPLLARLTTLNRIPRATTAAVLIASFATLAGGLALRYVVVSAGIWTPLAFLASTL